MLGKARLWPFLGAVAVLPLVVFLVSGLTEPELIPVDRSDAVTVAGRLEIEPVQPRAGRPITVRATVSTDRPVTLRGFTVRVHDEAGASHDFPELADVDLGAEPKSIELERVLPKPGIYTYYLAYRQDNEWVSLPPWQHVMVG